MSRESFVYLFTFSNCFPNIISPAFGKCTTDSKFVIREKEKKKEERNKIGL